MTNKEKYKKAFSTLHASTKNSLEVEIMEKMKKTYIMKKALAACAVVAIAFGSLSVAYAADLGGIQEKLYTWFHGAKTKMSYMDNGGGNYSYTFTDQDGEIHEGSAGGIALDDDGNEIPLSAEEVLGQIGTSEVSEDEDGNVWIYFYDKQINITDLFSQNDICKVAIKNESYTAYEGDTVYFEIEKAILEENGKAENVYNCSVSTTTPADVDSYTHID